MLRGVGLEVLRLVIVVSVGFEDCLADGDALVGSDVLLLVGGVVGLLVGVLIVLVLGFDVDTNNNNGYD